MLKQPVLPVTLVLRMKNSVLSFFAGALLFSALTTAQNLQTNTILSPGIYVLPILLGGLAGLAVLAFYIKQAQKLLNSQGVQAKSASETPLPGDTRYVNQALLNDMQTFVALLETNGDIIFMNNTPLKLGDIELKDVVGKRFYETPWWTHAPEVSEALKQDIARCRNGESFSHDVQNQIADGSLVWIEYSMHPIYDDDGQVKHLVAEGRDITEQIEAFEKLRRSGREYQGLFDNTPVAIWREDFRKVGQHMADLRSRGVQDFGQYLDDHPAEILKMIEEVEVLDVNKRAIKMFGAQCKEDLLGSIASPNSPDSIRVFKEELLAIWEGKNYFESEAQVKTLDGKFLDIMIGMHVEDLAEGPDQYKVIVTMLDVTSRKLAEEALRDQECFHVAILDDLQTFVAVLEPNGNVLFANNTPLKIAGIELKDVVGKKYYDAPWWTYSEEVHQIMINNIEKCARGESFAQDIQIQVADGSLLWIEYSMHPIYDGQGNVKYLVPEGRDISSRVKAETDRHLALIEINSIMETVPDIIFLLDTEGNMLNWNQSTEEKTGYSREEMMALDSMSIIHPDDREQAFKAICRTYENGYTSTELRLYTKDQESIPYLFSGTVRRDDNGRKIGLVTMAKDITELKQLEKQLQQVHKMEAIGTMAGGIAHDFNNVLAAIIGHTELAIDDTSDQSPAKHSLRQILIASNRAKQLVHHILAFSRMSSVTKGHSPIDICDILKEVLEFQRSIIPASIQVQSSLCNNMGLINGDSTQIHQIIVNLCTNALHAMENEVGVLEVGLVVKELAEKDITLEPGNSPGSYFVLSVRDTGVGLSPDLIDKIFDPYFTTKEVGKGSGMGLSVVLSIVKNHGGFIRVHSELGKGSRFDIYFPRIDMMVAEEPKKRPELPSAGKGRILFVDDEEMLATLGKRRLEMQGYSVTSMTSSSEALELFEKDPTQFDLVITDQTMPVITGSDLAVHLLKIRPDIPIILCTGYSAAIDKVKTENIGIKEYAMKPVEQHVLVGLIEKCLSENLGSDV